MAKYLIEFSCGHSEEKQLFGPSKERQRKIDYFERSGSCSTCWRESKDAEGPSVVVRIARIDDKQVLCEIICTNSYAVRYQLASRGFKFSDRLCLERGLAGMFTMAMRPEKGWVWTARGTPDEIAAGVTRQLLWLNEQAWPIHQQSEIGLMFASVFEGRPELAGIKMR